MSTHSFENLILGFYDSVARYPQRPALEVGHRVYTYAALCQQAGAIARAILAHQRRDCDLACVLAYRSASAYAGVLGVLAAGKGYVPLHPQFPTHRTVTMLDLSGAHLLVVGSEAGDILEPILENAAADLTIIFPDAPVVPEFCRRFPRHQYVSATECAGAAAHDDPLPLCAANDIAYMLFTSGSTGVPKAVPVRQHNVTAYLDYIGQRYSVCAEDRCSQAFDLTFDLSVHDLFVCWWNGACLCAIPHRSLMAPGKFIRDKKLTMWFSVPSVAAFMSKMRMLKAGSLPSLRYSLFCGEPLAATCAQQWQEAAPNSALENLYGPTEATIAISHYRWDALESPAKCRHGIVPIGWLFPGHRGCVVDGEQHPLARGQRGELCLAGPQVTSGYLNDPAKTRAQFVHLEDQTLWYRTGDLVRQESDGCFYYLGRVDHQVQIRGHRVELQEIDHVLCQALGSTLAVAVPWPASEGRADAVYGFACQQRGVNEQRLLDACKSSLPDYMVPQRIFCVPELPKNANGKIDRTALARRLEQLLHES